MCSLIYQVAFCLVAFFPVAFCWSHPALGTALGVDLGTGLGTGLGTDLVTGLSTGLGSVLETGLGTGLGTDLNSGLSSGLGTGLATGLATALSIGLGTDLSWVWCVKIYCKLESELEGKLKDELEGEVGLIGVSKYTAPAKIASLLSSLWLKVVSYCVFWLIVILAIILACILAINCYAVILFILTRNFTSFLAPIVILIIMCFGWLCVLALNNALVYLFYYYVLRGVAFSVCCLLTQNFSVLASGWRDIIVHFGYVLKNLDIFWNAYLRRAFE